MSWHGSTRSRLSSGTTAAMSSSSSSGIVEDFTSHNSSQCSSHFQTSKTSKKKKVVPKREEDLHHCCDAAEPEKIFMPLSAFEITITSQDDKGHRIVQPCLPHDPRKWSQEEVRQWLIWTSARHSLPIDPARFPMNGKSLCLMSLAMFSYRLPLGGKLLYKDFQLRLTAAFHIEDNLDRHHQKIIKIIHH